MVMSALCEAIHRNSKIAPWLAFQVAQLSKRKQKVRLLVEELCHFISGDELELQRI
jgi:hypothetical protein